MIPAELLPISRDWPHRPITEWLDELADWIADHHPTPLDLPAQVVKTRAALGLPERDHLIVTTNHAALTLSPWNIARCLIAEELVLRLLQRGVAAHSLVLPLDHNTLGDANRPAVLFLGGRSWTWRGMPRQARRVVASIELHEPEPGWRKKIHDTLAQDASRAWQRLQGHELLGGVSRRAFVDGAVEATQRTLDLIFRGGRSGRADLVWTEMQSDLLDALGFSRTTVLPMARIERTLASEAPWFDEPLGEIQRILSEHPGIEASLGRGEAGEDPMIGSVSWSRGMFWFLCEAPCKAAGTLQAVHAGEPGGTHKIQCSGCGRTRAWTAQDAMAAVQTGELHPRVHLLVLWIRRGLAPIIHTAGPQMTLYAHAVDALQDRLPQDSSLPPQIFLPLGRMIPAAVLSSLFLSIMPRLEKLGSGEIRGTRLWREVVDRWASTGPWESVEKRLGPRLRDGGFPPAAEGQGVLESALREWGWWPPSGRAGADAPTGRSMDTETADLVHGFLAWARPFRWAGGWDWLWSGLGREPLAQPIMKEALHQVLRDSGNVPNAPMTPIHLPRWLSGHGETTLARIGACWGTLLNDR